MSDKTSLTGGCLCGDVRYSARAAPFAADYCHCSKCRNSTGAPVSAWMDFNTSQLEWHRREGLVEYESSETVRRGFCRRCGSTLTFRSVDHPQYCSLAINSLDTPELVQPTYHIYTDNQLAWFRVDDDCRRYAQGQT